MRSPQATQLRERIAAEGGIVLHELGCERGSLEEAFMQLTGQAVEYRTDFDNRTAALAGAPDAGL